MNKSEFENGRKTWIDAFKGIAICVIILVHCNARTMPGVFGKFGFSGWSGVQIFFMISAYLTLQSLEHLENTLNFSVKQRMKWILNKIKKLIPMFYFGILLYLFILRGNESWLAGVGGKVTFLNLLSHLTFTHSLFPYYSNSIMGIEWYLGDLVLLYFTSTLIYKKINSAKRAFVCFISSVLLSFIFQAVLLQFQPLPDEWVWDSYVNTIFFFSQLPSMTMGYLLFYLERNTHVMNRLRERKIKYAVLMIAGICIYLVTTVMAPNRGQIILYTISYSLIILCVIAKPIKIIENQLFITLGKNSYEIYIIHYLLIQLYERKCKAICRYNSINIIIEFIVILLVSFIVTYIIKLFYRRGIIWIRSRH